MALRVVLTVAAALGAVAGVVFAARASAPADVRDPAAPVGVTNTRDPAVVESYWTDERRRNATGG
jgi:Flp pilus assembly protein CpaB